MEFLEIPVTDIHPSPTNPRKHFGDLLDLIASVASSGVLQPIVVRQSTKVKAGGVRNGASTRTLYECVFGHRRLEASIRAKLATIPAIVREYSDLQVLEAQLVENCHREDIHPLEEADAYRTLLESHGYDAQQIADKVGKSKSYVYGRLKLCSLSAKGRKAFFDGKIDASVALVLARIPVPKLQDEALQEAFDDCYREDKPTHREVLELVQRRYMLRLKDAPFKPEDATLCPKAGACSACPKRTGNQAELFADVASADMCTDPTCYSDKTSAHWKRRVAEHKAGGGQILEGKDAQKKRGSYRSLDDDEYLGGRYVTVRSIVKGKLAAGDLVLMRDGDQILELVSRSTASRIIQASQPKTKRRATSSSNGIATRQKRENEIRRKTGDAAIALVMANAPKVCGDWAFIARGVLKRALSDVHKAVVRRRGIEPKTRRQYGGVTKDYEGTLRAIIDTGSIEDAQQLTVELICSHDVAFGSVPKDGPLAAAVKTAGGDLGKLEAKVKAEISAAAAAKKTAKKANAKKKPTAKPAPAKKAKASSTRRKAA